MRLFHSKASSVVQRHPSRSGGTIHRRPHVVTCRASGGLSGTGLVFLPSFPGSTVLLPTFRGSLNAFEPQYITLFRGLMERKQLGAKFLHILDPSLVPPAMMSENADIALPAVGCAAIIDKIEVNPSGSLRVDYTGDRRVQVHHVEDEQKVTMVGGFWYDDDEDATSGEEGVTLHAVEQEVAGIVKEILRLSKLLDPDNAAFPKAIQKYAPLPPGRTRQTSYDALKASGHNAAVAIDTWRRHGSVYDGPRGPTRPKHADPYTQVADELGRGRREELFSFAVSQLLEMGVPERAALLLSQDTLGRLEFVAAAARPYLSQLRAQAALKEALD